MSAEKYINENRGSLLSIYSQILSSEELSCEVFDKKLDDKDVINLVKSNLDDIKNILKNKTSNNITKTEDLFNDSDQCLLMLTEAPNCNIEQWTEKKYINNNGNN